MEAFRWAPHSPRRGRAPAPTALVPGAHYAGGPGPAQPQPFSSWHDYLGLATLVTRAVRGERRFGGSGGGGGSPPSSSSSPCCSPHAGPGPGALGPPDDDDDEDEDEDEDGDDEPGAALELRALELRAGPAEAGLPGGRCAELSPFAGRAAAVLLGCAPATATGTAELAPREERGPAWAAEPPLHGGASGAGAAAAAAAARGLRPELQVCVFCRNNREAVALYTTHTLKGPDGRVLCPVLRRYTCPLCGASGDHAHTIKYCPLSKAPPPPRSARDGPQGKRLR